MNEDKSQDIRERTFRFALRTIRLCRQLEKSPGASRALGYQLIKSGTSVGANVEEAKAGQSTADFVHKIEIALKEARETSYWLRLLIAAEIVSLEQLGDMQAEADEIARVLGAIAVNAKKKIAYKAKK